MKQVKILSLLLILLIMGTIVADLREKRVNPREGIGSPRDKKGN